MGINYKFFEYLSTSWQKSIRFKIFLIENSIIQKNDFFLIFLSQWILISSIYLIFNLSTVFPLNFNTPYIIVYSSIITLCFYSSVVSFHLFIRIDQLFFWKMGCLYAHIIIIRAIDKYRCTFTYIRMLWAEFLFVIPICVKF